MEEIAFLGLTIAAELPIALLFLRKEDWRRVTLAVLAVNMISHPIVWQLLYRYHTNWFAAEAGVALFEGAMFALLCEKRRTTAAFAAIAMNVFSAAIGWFFF